ncbi:hypothetical protein Hanom_Chr14g01299001 [Helianthus anomalus]
MQPPNFLQFFVRQTRFFVLIKRRIDIFPFAQKNPMDRLETFQQRVHTGNPRYNHRNGSISHNKIQMIFTYQNIFHKQIV